VVTAFQGALGEALAARAQGRPSDGHGAMSHPTAG